MKSNQYFKLVALVLTICILSGPVLPAMAAAAEIQAKESTDVSEAGPGSPKIAEQAETETNWYTGRVKEAEPNLSTLIFANGDGTNTMRVYCHPVKYVSKNGEVRDISLDIQAKAGGGFVTADHEIITTFAHELTDGITLEYNNIEIALAPELTAGANPIAVLGGNGKSVAYTVNNTTAYVYELTYAGFKEDIVVKEYTGQTEYEFTLYTNGLTLCQEYGSYYLADADGNVRATIGDIIVFTADERNNTMGSMTHETVLANQEYRLTIHLDAAYLADADTAYPIRIDPTIEINYDNNGAGAIQDVTIKQNSTYSGTTGSVYVGRHTDGYLSRALMRFPNLSLSGISASQITAATVELRDLMCQGSEDITVECRIYNNASPAWSETGTTTWSSVGTTYVGALLDAKVISYGNGNVSGEQHRYAFNILTAAKAWANGTQSAAKGLVFKANDAFENQTGAAVKTWYKTFASYNRSSYKPSLSITYTAPPQMERLNLNRIYPVDITTGGSTRLFQFIPTSTGFYTFLSIARETGDPHAWLNNTDKVALAYNDNGGGDYNFSITYHLISGNVYYFTVGCLNSGTGSYSVTIISAAPASLTSTANLPQASAINISCTVRHTVKVYKFTPEVTEEYLFFSTGATGVPIIWIYDTSLLCRGSNDAGAGNGNFRQLITLTANQTYYIAVGQSGTYTLNLLNSADIPTDIYFLRNIGTSKCADIHGPNEQEWVHQWDMHIGVQEKWEVKKQSDGYYTIQSQYGSKKYIGISSTIVGENNIKLFSSVTDAARWKIYQDRFGRFVFEPKNAPGKLLYAPDSYAGTELQLIAMGSNASNRQWWNVLIRNYTYVNYYDSSVRGDGDFIRNISNANSFAHTAFSKYFYTGLDAALPASMYPTAIEDCSGTTCGNFCCGSHHIDSDRVMDNLCFRVQENNHLYVLWMNREETAYCQDALNNPNGNPVIAKNRTNEPAALFLTVPDQNDPILQTACMAMVLVHETAHIFGLGERYGIANHDINDQTVCVMEVFDKDSAADFYENVSEGNAAPFCQSCMNTLWNELYPFREFTGFS